MRSLLAATAAILLTASVSWWWLAGAHLGWSKTSVQVWRYDEVTEISYPETEKRLVPGIEFLAGVVIASLVIGGIGLRCRKK